MLLLPIPSTWWPSTLSSSPQLPLYTVTVLYKEKQTFDILLRVCPVVVEFVLGPWADNTPDSNS